jgi:GH24 family phage-related lysozyme (muramidase)
MSDFGGGSFDPGTSSGGGQDSFDPSAGGGGGQDAFDPSALGMGSGGWSPFGGGGGFGGGGVSSPSQTAGTAFDPAAQSAQQANQQQQQQQQSNKPPSRGSQLEDAIKSLFGGAQHAMSPTLQSLASTAQHGMGWFNQAAKSTATPDALSPTPSDQGPQNDPGSVAGGPLPSGGTGSVGQDTHDIMNDLRQMFGLQAPSPQTAGASTGPTGNEATQAAQEPASGATGDFTPAAVPQLAPPADPAAQVGAAQQDPDTSAAAPDHAAPASSAATPPPQSAPTSGENNQPGPGDQVTGSASSAGAAGTGGQYAPGSQQWQSNPTFALLDLLRGDFGSFMKDLMGQQGVPPGQNRAGAPRPPQYGRAPGTPQVNQAQAAQGPAATQGITDPFTAGVPPQGTLPATAKAGPPSGTPSAGNPAGSSAAATGASAPPPSPAPAAPLGTRPAAPVPQASAAQRAALGLDPAATSGAPAASAPPAAATNAPPAATAAPAGSPDAPRSVQTARTNGRQAAVNAAAAAPAGAAAGYLDPIRRFEGFAPRAQWDYHQSTNGYGTRARSPGEQISRQEAEVRLRQEAGQHYNHVSQRYPNAPANVKNALTSFTFNLGDGPITPGSRNYNPRLDQALQSGNYGQAAQIMQGYTHAGGRVLDALVRRRQQEGQMMIAAR